MLRFLPILLAISALAAPSEYSHRVWRTQDGLPQSKIQSLAQTEDSYLWIGTSGGLVRFDGVRFVVYDRSNTPALRDDSILALLPAQDHSLWIGTEGGGLVHLSHNFFQTYARPDGLTNLFVRSLHQDRSGTLWVGTDRGFFRFDRDRLTRLDGTPGLPVVAASTILEDRSGTLWLGGQLGLLSLTGGKLNRTPIHTAIRSLRLNPDGTIQLATAAGLRTLDPRAPHTLTLPDPLFQDLDPQKLYSDTAGNLWIGTVGEGLVRVHDHTSETFRDPASLPDNSVLSLLEDRQHNIWVGTQDGLVRLTRTAVTALTTKNGLADANVSTIYQDPAGAIWIATITGKLYHLEADRALPVPLPPSSNVFRTSYGDLWLGTLNQGIARILPAPAVFHTTEDGLRNDHARQFLEDRRNNLWIATGSGLLRWTGSTFQQYYLEDGLSYGSIRSLAELRHGPHQGDILVGSDGGLNRIHDEKFVRDPALIQFNGEKIWAMLEDSDGVVWLGTRGSGLFRLHNGKLTRFTTRDGLPSNFIYQILDDRHGRLWISSPSGILSVDRAGLNAMADRGTPGPVSVVPYDVGDGLESTQMNGGIQPAGAAASNGVLWFPSVRGAVRVDPTQLRITHAPPVLIESIFADEAAIPLTPKPRIPPGRRKLEIDYTACDLSSPERLTFQYKLEGFDTDWTPASHRRAAYYTNLPAGDYTFRVIATDATSPHSPFEASIAFTWEPHLYQSTWFYALCAALTALAIWAGLHLYANQTRTRYALLLAERTRLAREMHDIVIQGCVGVSTLLEAAGDDLTAAHAKRMVKEARNQVRQTIDEAREAVWDLRHTALTGDLDATLATFIQQFQSEHAVDFQMEVAGPKTPLSEDANRNLLLVAREAIRNSLAHAHPTRIRIDLTFETSSLRMAVTDDGCGFDPTHTRGPETSHYGLLGMRERVEKLGGSLAVESSPGGGTGVLVRVPYERN